MDCKSLINVITRQTSIDASLKIPPECRGAIFFTTFGRDSNHFYFLIDLARREITNWSINVEALKEHLLSLIGPRNAEIFPRSLRDLQQYCEALCTPHSALYHSGEIYVTMTNANFFFALDCESKSVRILSDKANPEKIFSSTSAIFDNRLFFSRYDVKQTFARFEDHEHDVPVELCSMCLKTGHSSVIGNVPGTADIHTTAIIPSGEALLMLEMCKDPRLQYPTGALGNSAQLQEILESGLHPSHLLYYHLPSKQLHKTLIPGCPAHVEFDRDKPEIVYVVRHNNSTTEGRVLAFGPAQIDQYLVSQTGCALLKTYTDQEFYRAPSLETVTRDGRQLLLCPSYPDHMLIIDAQSLAIRKRICVAQSNYSVSFSRGAFIYPIPLEDLSPYTVHGIDDSPLVYATNIHDIKIVDTDLERQIAQIPFNFSKCPIRATGHSLHIRDLEAS